MGEGWDCTQGHCTDEEKPQQARAARAARQGAPFGGVSPVSSSLQDEGIPRHTGGSGLELPLTLSRVLGVDSEDSRLVHYSVGEARPVSSDMAAVDVIHIELEGAS